MFTDRTPVSRVLCLLSLISLASCFGGPIKIKGSDAAVAGQQGDGGGAGGEAGPGDGLVIADSKIPTDGPSSNGGAGGNSGTVDSSVGGSGGSATGGGGAGGSGVGGSAGGASTSDASANGGNAGGASTSDASANGGSSAGGRSKGGNGGTGGGIAGSGGAGPDAAPDVQPDVPAIDAPGTCSADKDCTSQAPLCLGNRCAKCTGDSDCVGRAGPACAASGLCVACTASKHCTGTAATCDTATNQCVGCITRSDCAGACQTCTGGVCAAVKGKDDPGFCDGTCDSAGACKKKQGQTCQQTADCAGGMPCADGYCCNRACTGTCEACDLATSPGTCAVLPANTAARHGSCAGSGTCAGTCQGKADGTCTFPTSSCGTAGCATTTSTQAAGSCSGAGTCNMPPPVSCKTGATCSGSTCSCPQGTDDCGSNGCINTSGRDVNHCGSCTTVCASNQICALGSCHCSIGAADCGSCLGWDFESGTQNWIKDSNPNVWLGTTNGAQNPTTSTTTVCPSSVCPGSTRALQVPMSMDQTTTYSSGVAVPLCGSGATIEVLNRTISMQVYFDGTADFGVLSAMFAHAWNSAGEVQCNLKWGMTVHSWFPATCTFVDSFQANHIAIQVNNSGSAWSGTMYVDNVQIN